MADTYFDIKRKLKKLYDASISAVKKLNARHTNYLLLELDVLKNELSNSNVNSFGRHVLNKDIEQIRYVINTNLKKKKLAAGVKSNEKVGPKKL
jgi:hypothetical protein